MARVSGYKTAASSPYKVQVLDRALDILRVLGDRQTDCGLAELCAELQLHKSTVHRLAMVLERHRLVERNPDTGRYRLGLRLFELGSRALSVVDLRNQSRPYLNQVLQETQETVHLCILDGSEIVYLEKLEPERSVRLASRVGRRAPAYCTSVGKAMLAGLSGEEVEEIIRASSFKKLTKHTITTPAQLKMELQKIRARGYALDNEENEEGVRCVGAAVQDHGGKPIAAISVSGPAFRVSKAKTEKIAESVMHAAAGLSAASGYDFAHGARREKAAGA